jgi:LacI family transcriptional regulator
MKPRIKDIAEKANVSKGTVDRVIHDRGEVATETKKRVLTIVKELGYKPNILAQSLAKKKKYSIGILLPDYKQGISYWKFPIKGIEKAFKEFNHFGIDIIYSLYDTYSKNSYLNAEHYLISKNPSAIITATVFSDEINSIISHCKESSIPLIFIDSLPDNNDEFFIGQDSYLSGKVAAGILNFGMPCGGNIKIIKITNDKENNNHLTLRIKGFKDYFEKNKNNEINISELNISHSINNVLNELLKNEINSKINAIFIPNSRAYIIAEFIEKNNLKNIKLIGFDLIDKNIEYLNKGIIDFLLSQNPEKQGYKAMQAIVNKLIMNIEPEKKQYLPIDIITKENINYYNL